MYNKTEHRNEEITSSSTGESNYWFGYQNVREISKTLKKKTTNELVSKLNSRQEYNDYNF